MVNGKVLEWNLVKEIKRNGVRIMKTTNSKKRIIEIFGKEKMIRKYEISMEENNDRFK